MFVYTVLLLCVFNDATAAVAQSNILASLGNHGDRISDLESKMLAFTSTINGLQQQLQDVLTESTALKQDIVKLKSLPTCTCATGVSSLYNPPSSKASTSLSLASTGATVSPATPLTTSTTNRNFTSSTLTTARTSTAQSMSSSPKTTTMQSLTASTSTVRSPTVTATLSSPSTSATQTTAMPSTSTKATTTAAPIYADCNDAWASGGANSGVIKIQPAGFSSPIHVYCNMHSTDQYRGIIIQRRIYGNVSFDRRWNDYKRGFGELTGDFWIGNEILHQLTSRNKNYKIVISLKDWSGQQETVKYSHFMIGSESEKYRLNVGTYSGGAGDSFNYIQSYSLRHNHMPFSTKDRDNDPHFLNCANQLHGGWWFNRCYSSNLNGPYLSQPYGHRVLGETYGDPTLDGTGIEWYPWKHKQYSLKESEMMIKLT